MLSRASGGNEVVWLGRTLERTEKPAVHRGLEGSVMGWRDESSRHDCKIGCGSIVRTHPLAKPQRLGTLKFS